MHVPGPVLPILLTASAVGVPTTAPRVIAPTDAAHAEGAVDPRRPAQEASVEGEWAMVWATSVRRTRDQPLEVLRESEATLRIGGDDEELVGTWIGEIPERGDVTIHLRGEWTAEGLVLRPVRVDGPTEAEGGFEFEGLHIEGQLEEGRLSGTIWSLLAAGETERHLGPLPWRATRRDDTGTGAP